LGAELAELGAISLDLQELGFEAEEIAALSATGGSTGLTDPDDAPEPHVNPVATRGDVWALGRHRNDESPGGGSAN